MQAFANQRPVAAAAGGLGGGRRGRRRPRRPHNRVAALALVPYGAWVTFATALTSTIAASN